MQPSDLKVSDKTQQALSSRRTASQIAAEQSEFWGN